MPDDPDRGDAPFDEELPERAPRSPARRRALLALALLVVVALVVLAVVRATSHSTPRSGASTVTVSPHPRSSSASTRATRSVVPPPAKPPAVLSPLRSLSKTAIAAARAECPRLSPACMTTGETPADVFAAVRSAFPSAGGFVAVSDLVYTDENVPYLAYRRMAARAGRLQLAIEIRQTQPGDGDGSVRIPGDVTTVVRYEIVSGRFTVEVQGSAPSDRYVDTDRLRRLASDPRLLEIG